MSKVIYVCKTKEEFEELCSVFKFDADYNLFTCENIYLRVEDGVALADGYLPWILEDERFKDYKIIRYHKGMLEDAIDDVKSPSHYKLEGLGLESKDIIKSVLGKDGYKNWCHGTALKYLFRAGKKEDELKDFKKAKEYISWIIKEMEE